MSKVTFDGINKLIVVDNTITSLNVKIDLYSDWKEWFKESDNAKYLKAMRTIGGDPTTGIKSVSPYFFLTNGWKIRPYEGDHTLTIDGNLFVDEPETYGYNLTVPTLGDYTVTINLSTTSDAIVVSAGSGLSTEEHNQLMETALQATLLNAVTTISDNNTRIKTIEQINSGCWELKNNQLIIKCDDNETELFRFNLTDAQGQPSMTQVMKRDRV